MDLKTHTGKKEKTMEHQVLKDMNACDLAIAWASKYPTLEEAWKECERGDWMIWFAANNDTAHNLIIAAMCGILQRALTHTSCNSKIEMGKIIAMMTLYLEDKATMDDFEDLYNHILLTFPKERPTLKIALLKAIDTIAMKAIATVAYTHIMNWLIQLTINSNEEEELLETLIHTEFANIIRSIIPFEKIVLKTIKKNVRYIQPK
jgi:hypothetical protein